MNPFNDSFIDDIYQAVLTSLAVKDPNGNIVGTKRLTTSIILDLFDSKFNDSIVCCLDQILSTTSKSRPYAFGYIGGKSSGYFIRGFDKSDSNNNDNNAAPLTNEQQTIIKNELSKLMKTSTKISLQLLAMLIDENLKISTISSIKKQLRNSPYIDWSIKGEYYVKST